MTTSLSLLIWPFLILMGCGKVSKKADLSNILSGYNHQVVVQSSSNAQEISFEKSNLISREGVELRLAESSLHLSLFQKESELVIKPEAIGLQKEWKDYESVTFSFRNLSDDPVRITLVLWSHRGRLPDTLYLNAKGRQSKQISLRDLPLIGSVTRKYDVNEIQLLFQCEQNNQEILIEEISLRYRFGALPPVVDSYGQRISTTWPEKITSDAALLADLRGEKETLLNQFPSQQFDQYRGLKTGKDYTSTGYFRLQMNEDSTWYFITPEGHPFWSFGITGVRPKKARHGVTLIEGNEQLFQELPDKDGSFGDAYIDSTFSFYFLNLLKKYGEPEPWRTMAFNRLSSWGLNTIGNWAEEELIHESETPFTYSFISGIERWNNDVYHPAWMNHLDSVISDATKFRVNPYLIGYFVDNEASWGNLALQEKLPSDAFLRAVWIEEIKKEFSDIDLYNIDRGTNFRSWEELKTIRVSERIPGNDRIFLEKLYTDKYFSSIAATLKKYDPNHLYLGCRFTRRLKPDHILQIAGRFCDVVTVNVYSYEPIKEQMDDWYRLTGRPILIGEHQAALKGPRQLPLRWRVFSEDERRIYFHNYVRTWAKMPYSLGSHWYQFADQHITGRASNGENQLVGFVDITDQPHAELVETARIISDSIYYWHGINSRYHEGI